MKRAKVKLMLELLDQIGSFPARAQVPGNPTTE
jgi:hypothetical protein